MDAIYYVLRRYIWRGYGFAVHHDAVDNSVGRALTLVSVEHNNVISEEMVAEWLDALLSARPSVGAVGSSPLVDFCRRFEVSLSHLFSSLPRNARFMDITHTNIGQDNQDAETAALPAALPRMSKQW